MANKIKLHTEKDDLKNAILITSKSTSIAPDFIEKDYWISLILKRLSKSKYVDSVVFKGGTSLSKGHKLIHRFSEDVDIAVIIKPETSGNQTKTLIRTVEKEIANDLTEIDVKGITSKGSRFRKSVYEYPILQKQNILISNSIIVEINSFANPFPFHKLSIQSMIGEYFQSQNRDDLIKQFGLQAFEVNVLDKEQTLIEKLVSLVRFSFDQNPVDSIKAKIRHFYDLYYLLNDKACESFVNSQEFLSQFSKVLEHDQEQFDEPTGWNSKKIEDSPLFNNFDLIWEKLKATYSNELSMLAFVEIPDEKEVAIKFKELINRVIKIK
jgi:predicted nucleotidyltransferase component of viral defense system